TADNRAVTTRESAIEALISPASVAIVGASPSSYVGRVLCENLRVLGYEGDVFPINPKYDEILGWRSYPSLEDVPSPPEAVVAAVRIELVPAVLRAAGEKGARAAVVPGGGFTETGPEALKIQQDIAAVAAECGMAVCGPNCMGVIAPPSRSALYIGTIPPTLLAGRVALVSQSGSVVEAAVNMGPRIGFSALVSCGNEIGTTVGDYFRYFARDPTTTSVVLFIEGFRDPSGFIDGARTLREAGKPLAVLHAGRSKEAAHAVGAHSGTLASSHEVVTGLLRQLGAIEVDDLDDLFETAELLGQGNLPGGRRMFVVTDSGGEGNLVADHAGRVGLELPAPSETLRKRLRTTWPHFSYIGNPIDPWGVDPDYHRLYTEILAAAAAEDVDILAVALDKVTPWAGENEVDLGIAAAKALIQAARGSDKLPVFFTLPATGPAAESVRELLRSAGIPLLHGIRPAVGALYRSWWWRAWRPRQSFIADGEPPTIDVSEPGPVLSERMSREILAAYGIPLVAGEAAATAEEAAQAAERLGFPVVMKADAAGLAHKAAHGLVTTGVPNADRAREAFTELTARATDESAPARGVLVQATGSGVELICGMRRDPLFGPVVLLGLGGTLTEALQDVSVRLCPVSREDVEEMPDESMAGRLLDAAGASRDHVHEVLIALSQLAVGQSDIEEVDVNPLFAGSRGAVAADALVVLRRQVMEEKGGNS
ncbi:MAG TPA: acetate--CoA ligase family protein, partial [Actinomycetota bacterium]|nr:acetate--CoA ligase family protein [Actinomycetota bacterium]